MKRLVAFAKQFKAGNPVIEWAAGVAFPRQSRIVLRAFGTALFNLRQTFEHEISHILVYRAVEGRHVPRWLMEGFAIYQAGESLVDHGHTAAGADGRGDDRGEGE